MSSHPARREAGRASTPGQIVASGQPGSESHERRSALDEAMPTWDFQSRHEVAIAASAVRVVAAVEQYEPTVDRSWFVRLLFRLRGFTPGASVKNFREALESEGFRVLAERPGGEIVFGIAGRFWRFYEPSALQTVPDLAAFRAFAEPGAAKAAMGLHVHALGPERSLLTTETRIACVDAAARRRFALYWGLIKPASGWIRREMLGAIAQRATRL